MRLIACHIDNFGKLSNVSINFNEGINIINEPNGWGKSTFAAFLKAMLYGFDSKKEAGAFAKERILYTPWQGGAFGGELDFQVGEKQYRISRSFGASEKNDEFHLYDLSTNLECGDYSSDIGEELFGLDSASFKRTIYIAQNDCASGTSDSINAKLGNLADNTSDINNFETVSNLLKENMNRLSPNRITGSLKKRRNVITQLSHEIQGYDAAETAAAEVSEKLVEKREQKAELQSIRQDYAKALKVASEDSRRLELKKSYKSLCNEVDEAEDYYETVRRQLPSEIPSDELIEGHMAKARMIEENKAVVNKLKLSDEEQAKYDELHDRFRGSEPSDSVIDDMLTKANNIVKVKNEHNQLAMKLSQMESVAMLTDIDRDYDEQPKKSGKIGGGIFVIILGIITGLVAVVFYLNYSSELYQMITYGIAGAGVLFIIIGIILIIAGTKRNKKNKIEFIRKIEERENLKKEKEEPIREMRTQLSAIESGVGKLEITVVEFLEKYQIEYSSDTVQSSLFKLKADCAEYRRYMDVIAKYSDANEMVCELGEEIRKFGLGFGIRFDNDITSELTRIQAKSAEEKMARKALNAAQEKKKSFEELNDVSSILAGAECPYSLEELNNMIHEVDKRLEEIQISIEQYARMLEDLQEQLDLRDEKVLELANCEALQESEQHKYDILSTTSDYLQKAKEQFTARYMAPIADGFQKYYGILTGDTSRNWMVDANISLKMKEQGEFRDVQWLSAGYQDLVGICMRLGMVDAMYQDEKPFLILDDPFVNLDDEKLAQGEKLLIALEDEYQAIYFTCHESREYK